MNKLTFIPIIGIPEIKSGDNIPKIINKIIPFALLFSFTYVIAKYELNNELMIFWNFGINKIQLINFILI